MLDDAPAAICSGRGFLCGGSGFMEQEKGVMQCSFLACVIWLAALPAGAAADEPAPEVGRCSMWVDSYRGEPVPYEAVVDDLAGVRVVYLGERHRLVRHHEMQARIIADLAARGRRLVVGLEQIEATRQPVVDRFNAGQLDFEQLAEATDWAKRWPNYQQYRPVLEAARKANAPLVALNAPAETIRQVARGGGVEQLDPELRRQLPREMMLDDEPYARLLGIYMHVHLAATPERLRPMVEAQIARDEHMADVLARFLQSPEGKDRMAVVVCGVGHVSYALGMPARVRRRLDDGSDRVVVFSESGDVQLTPGEQAVSRPITITHEQLRAMGRPIGDYLYLVTPAHGDRPD
ncbi:MAG: ChaN family lipoprotein [Thermoguttaceae bacterium]|jgi:uncharacterized iron-regulated protein|nr:ChaN family lipoprotein [Thermoguttaceae bacterium]